MHEAARPHSSTTVNSPASCDEAPHDPHLSRGSTNDITSEQPPNPRETLDRIDSPISPLSSSSRNGEDTPQCRKPLLPEPDVSRDYVHSTEPKAAPPSSPGLSQSEQDYLNRLLANGNLHTKDAYVYKDAACLVEYINKILEHLKYLEPDAKEGEYVPYPVVAWPKGQFTEAEQYEIMMLRRPGILTLDGGDVQGRGDDSMPPFDEIAAYLTRLRFDRAIAQVVGDSKFREWDKRGNLLADYESPEDRETAKNLPPVVWFTGNDIRTLYRQLHLREIRYALRLLEFHEHAQSGGSLEPERVILASVEGHEQKAQKVKEIYRQLGESRKSKLDGLREDHTVDREEELLWDDQGSTKDDNTVQGNKPSEDDITNRVFLKNDEITQSPIEGTQSPSPEASQPHGVKPTETYVHKAESSIESGAVEKNEASAPISLSNITGKESAPQHEVMNESTLVHANSEKDPAAGKQISPQTYSAVQSVNTEAIVSLWQTIGGHRIQMFYGLFRLSGDLDFTILSTSSLLSDDEASSAEHASRNPRSHSTLEALVPENWDTKGLLGSGPWCNPAKATFDKPEVEFIRQLSWPGILRSQDETDVPTSEEDAKPKTTSAALPPGQLTFEEIAKWLTERHNASLDSIYDSDNDSYKTPENIVFTAEHVRHEYEKQIGRARRLAQSLRRNTIHEQQFAEWMAEKRKERGFEERSLY
ncbi:MAG: hypothetical protein Q9218_002765 [Villophora microphyllina]